MVSIQVSSEFNVFLFNFDCFFCLLVLDLNRCLCSVGFSFLNVVDEAFFLLDESHVLGSIAPETLHLFSFSCKDFGCSMRRFPFRMTDFKFSSVCCLYLRHRLCWTGRWCLPPPNSFFVYYFYY